MQASTNFSQMQYSQLNMEYVDSHINNYHLFNTLSGEHLMIHLQPDNQWWLV